MVKTIKNYHLKTQLHQYSFQGLIIIHCWDPNLFQYNFHILNSRCLLHFIQFIIIVKCFKLIFSKTI